MTEQLTYLLVEQLRIEESEVLKYLGVWIDNDLRFSVHVENCISKISKGIFVLRYFKKFCQHSLLMQIYHSFIVGNMNYCLSTWSFCSDKLVDRIFKLQKKAMRIIFGMKTEDSCHELFKKHKLLTFPAMIILKRATYIQENSKQITKLSDQHNFNTRNKNKFITPRENEYVKQCLLCYNALPLKDLKIDDNTELQKFSKLITEFLVEKEFYAVRELV